MMGGLLGDRAGFGPKPPRERNLRFLSLGTYSSLSGAAGGFRVWASARRLPGCGPGACKQQEKYRRASAGRPGVDAPELFWEPGKNRANHGVSSLAESVWCRSGSSSAATVAFIQSSTRRLDSAFRRAISSTAAFHRRWIGYRQSFNAHDTRRRFAHPSFGLNIL